MKYFILYLIAFFFKDISTKLNKNFFFRSVKKKDSKKSNFSNQKKFYFHKNGNKTLSFSTEKINSENKTSKKNIEFYLLIYNEPYKSYNLLSNKNFLNENDWIISLDNFKDNEIEINIKEIKKFNKKEITNFSEEELKFGKLFKVIVSNKFLNLTLNSKTKFSLRNKKNLIIEFEI